MKLQIDTNEKAVRLLESVPIGELIDTLKKLFPNKEWKDFTIQYVGEVRWKDVIYVPFRYDPPIYPWYGTGVINTTSSTERPELVSGVYNIETSQT